MSQLGHRTLTQVLGMQTATSTHLLLSQSAALIKLIRMAFNLGMGRLPPQHVMGMALCPGQEFSGRSLPTLQHIAGIQRHGSGGGDLNGHRELLKYLRQFCSNGYHFCNGFT